MCCDKTTSEDNDDGSGSDTDSGTNSSAPVKTIKRAKIGKTFKRIILPSDSEETANESLSANPILRSVSNECPD